MPSKAEKRALLKAQKQADFEATKQAQVAKLLAAPTKTPAEAASVVAEKKPAEYMAGTSRLHHNMVFATDWEDRVGAWTWGQAREWHPNPGDDHIYGYLKPYLAKTWNEIENETVGQDDRRNKAYDLGDICDEAFQRLVEIEKDDQERIFRFRMTNLERIYGFIDGITFRIVWYDELHNVCPSKKD